MNTPRYLGVVITEDGECEVGVKARIAMAKDALSRRQELLRRSMNRSTKKRIIKAVGSVVCGPVWL